MIILLECDLIVKMPSFYLKFAILKTKCVISEQETTADDEGHKICSNKLSLFNVFWLFHFCFLLLNMHAFVYSCCTGENQHLMCMRDPSYDYLEEIKMIHNVIRQMECWAIIQEIWLANVQRSNSLDIPFSVRSCTTLGDVKKNPLAWRTPMGSQCKSVYFLLFLLRIKDLKGKKHVSQKHHGSISLLLLIRINGTFTSIRKSWEVYILFLSF